MPRLVSFRGLIQNFRSKQQKNNFKFRFLEVWRITVLATWAFPVLKRFDPRTKTRHYPITEQIWIHMTWGSFSWQSTHKKRVVKHTRWKKFRFERKLWTLSLLTGMNRLQEKRNVSLISVCMGSIAIERGRSVTPPWPRQPGRTSWFSLGKRTLWRQKSNHIFCW